MKGKWKPGTLLLFNINRYAMVVHDGLTGGILTDKLDLPLIFYLTS